MLGAADKARRAEPCLPAGKGSGAGRVRGGSRGCARQPCAGLHRWQCGTGPSGGDAAGICTEREGFTHGIWQQIEKTTQRISHSPFPTLVNFYQCNYPPVPGRASASIQRLPSLLGWVMSPGESGSLCAAAHPPHTSPTPFLGCSHTLTAK